MSSANCVSEWALPLNEQDKLGCDSTCSYCSDWHREASRRHCSTEHSDSAQDVAHTHEARVGRHAGRRHLHNSRRTHLVSMYGSRGSLRMKYIERPQADF